MEALPVRIILKEDKVLADEVRVIYRPVDDRLNVAAVHVGGDEAMVFIGEI